MNAYDTLSQVRENAVRPFRFEDLPDGKEPKRFGPLYPALPSVEKWRRLARKRQLSAGETSAYGAAVGAAVRLLQRQELCGSASGEIDLKCTIFNAKKHRGKLTAALHAAANADRRALADADPDSQKTSDHTLDGHSKRQAYEAGVAARRARVEAEAAAMAAKAAEASPKALAGPSRVILDWSAETEAARLERVRAAFGRPLSNFHWADAV